MKKPTILFVEDNTFLRSCFCKYLRVIDSTILTAENGQVAFEIFLENKLDLIITDYQMPILNGLELAEKVKKHPKGKNLPILLTSIYSEWNLPDKSNIDAFFEKFDSKEEFLRIVQELLL